MMESTYKLRHTAAERATWAASAYRSGLTLAAWIRLTLTTTAIGTDALCAAVDSMDVVREEKTPNLCTRCRRLGIPSCDACRALPVVENPEIQF